jgi:hypothetical protein
MSIVTYIITRTYPIESITECPIQLLLHAPIEKEKDAKQ